MGLKAFFIVLAAFFITVWLSGFVSMGSLAASLTMPILIFLLGGKTPLIITAGLDS